MIQLSRLDLTVFEHILQLGCVPGFVNYFLCFRFTSNVQIADSSSIARSLELIYNQLLLYLQDKSQEYKIQLAESSLSIDSVLISVERIDEKNKRVFVTWTNQDEEVGKIVLHVLKTMSNTQGTSYQPIEIS